MFQVCGIDAGWSLLLHLPVCMLAVVPVLWRRRPCHLRKLELTFDCAKHLSGAVTGHAVLLLAAPVLRAVTGWATSCVWFAAISGVDSTVGLVLQIWAIAVPLAQLSRRHPKLVMGQYLDPRTSLKSPQRFRLQLAVWVASVLVLRLTVVGTTLLLALPVRVFVTCWDWILAVRPVTKTLLLAVLVPSVSRALHFRVLDPLIQAAEEDENLLWRPLCEDES